MGKIAEAVHALDALDAMSEEIQSNQPVADCIHHLEELIANEVADDVFEAAAQALVLATCLDSDVTCNAELLAKVERLVENLATGLDRLVPADRRPRLDGYRRQSEPTT